MTSFVYLQVTQSGPGISYPLRQAMNQENDIVLIYLEDSPLAFARIESIEPDIKRGWFLIKLLLLQIPLQVVTWILRDAYINGETFTMGGKEMHMEKVICPEDPEDPADNEPNLQKSNNDKPEKNAKVITLADLKKK
jgi:hypothetical protein